MDNNNNSNSNNSCCWTSTAATATAGVVVTGDFYSCNRSSLLFFEIIRNSLLFRKVTIVANVFKVYVQLLYS